MKKLLTLTALCALLTAPATAVQKCVPMDASGDMSCAPTVSNKYYFSPEWTTTCTNPMEGIYDVQIHGVAVCANPEASTAEEVFRVDGNIDNFTECWCKMISPVVSGWVWWDDGGNGQDFSSTEECLYNCANYCTRMGHDMAQHMFNRIMFD